MFTTLRLWWRIFTQTDFINSFRYEFFEPCHPRYFIGSHSSADISKCKKIKKSHSGLFPSWFRLVLISNWQLTEVSMTETLTTMRSKVKKPNWLQKRQIWTIFFIIFEKFYFALWVFLCEKRENPKLHEKLKLWSWPQIAHKYVLVLWPKSI